MYYWYLLFADRGIRINLKSTLRAYQMHRGHGQNGGKGGKQDASKWIR